MGVFNFLNKETMMTQEVKRIIRLFMGLFLYALGIVLTIHANVGLSPWDVFHQGLAKNLHITLGIANIVTAIFFVALAAAMKEHVGLGTLCNMLCIGLFIDILMSGNWIPVMRNFTSGVAMMISGLFVIALASVFYIGAGYGAGPRDSLMVILSKKTGRTAGFCRGCVEAGVLFFGWLLGGRAGIGTVISALGIGFAVQIVFGLLKFNVREIRQESFFETFRRLKATRPPSAL